MIHKLPELSERIVNGRYWIKHQGAWIRKAHYVWIAANGTIPPGCVIHHLNRNKTDDRLENLQMLPEFKHKSLHSSQATRSDSWRKMIGEHNRGNGNGMKKAIGGLNPAARKIINLDTGEIFETVKSASQKYEITPANISAVCHGRRPKCAGYRWAIA